MKKLLLLPLLALILLLPAPLLAQADTQQFSLLDGLKNLPGLKQGAAYDFIKREIDYFTTAEIVNYKGFSLSAGYSTSDKVVAAVDYDLGGLNRFGINTPILNAIDLRVGIYAGYGGLSGANSATSNNGNNKFAWGPEMTIVSLKF